MKQNIAFLYFIFHCFIIKAQPTQEEALIRQLDQHNAVTLINNDTAAMKKYLASDFIINGSGNKVSFGSEPILSSMRMGRVKYVQLDVVTDTVYYINKNTAISMGSETAVSGGEGPLKDKEIRRRYTNFWMMEEGVWKLKARHSSIICGN